MVDKHAIKITGDMKGVLISISGVPTTPTAYAHGFGAVPTYVLITHTAAGTTGVVQEVKTSRNSSSITLQASISGVGADVLVVP